MAVAVLLTRGQARVRHLVIWGGEPGYGATPLCRNRAGQWELLQADEPQPELPYCTRCSAEVRAMAAAVDGA